MKEVTKQENKKETFSDMYDRNEQKMTAKERNQN